MCAVFFCVKHLTHSFDITQNAIAFILINCKCILYTVPLLEEQREDMEKLRNGTDPSSQIVLL